MYKFLNGFTYGSGSALFIRGSIKIQSKTDQIHDDLSAPPSPSLSAPIIPTLPSYFLSLYLSLCLPLSLPALAYITIRQVFQSLASKKWLNHEVFAVFILKLDINVTVSGDFESF